MPDMISRAANLGRTPIGLGEPGLRQAPDPYPFSGALAEPIPPGDIQPKRWEIR